MGPAGPVLPHQLPGAQPAWRMLLSGLRAIAVGTTCITAAQPNNDDLPYLAVIRPTFHSDRRKLSAEFSALGAWPDCDCLGRPGADSSFLNRHPFQQLQFGGLFLPHGLPLLGSIGRFICFSN